MVELSDEMELVVIDKDGKEHRVTLAELKRYFGGWAPEDFPNIRYYKEAD